MVRWRISKRGISRYQNEYHPMDILPRWWGKSPITDM